MMDWKLGDVLGVMLVCGVVGCAVGGLALLGPVPAGIAGAGLALFACWLMDMMAIGKRR